MTTNLRVLSLLCGALFLALSWVWAYWIALLGFAFGGIACLILVWVGRYEVKNGISRNRSQKNLDTITRWLIIVSTVFSLLSLILILIAN